MALVIGNADYSAAPLANPVNDARLMATTLTALGFSVKLETDLDHDAMRRAIRDFGRSLQRGGVGLFYYAGHGVQVEGVNYLIPTGATINAEDDVSIEGVNVGDVLAKMGSARNRLNILILDACRDNPYQSSFRSGTRGLSALKAPIGTLIAYATSPGAAASDGTGQNGIYTGILVEEMQRPAAPLAQVFNAVRERVYAATDSKQAPWEESSIIGDFYFAGGGPQGNLADFQPRFRAGTEATKPVAAYVIAGSGLALLVAGGVFGSLAIVHNGQADSLCSATERSTTGCGKAAVDKSEAAMLEANLANVGIGLGLIGVAIGAGMWLAHSGSADAALAPHPSLTLQPELSPRRAGIRLTGSF